jgi:hypothetical protein
MKRAGWVLPSLVLVAGLMVLSGCADRPMGVPGDPAFVRGLADGFLAPFSFVVSLFNDHVRMYAFPNIGRWYDFGFLLGISVWGGGGAAASRR